MEKVIYTDAAERKLKQLVYTLYEEEYFGFIADAEEYVHAIYNFIDTVPRQKRKATAHICKGAWYSRYQHNRKTFWFILFDTDGETFVIRDIINNHSADYPLLIADF